ncbi:MAG: hypothetical protein GF353_09555 [Candidatus Lokiarchaeota archaeon]|nr:hypothetical protein [Candidatus Lokiarchaeota archaeon]
MHKYIYFLATVFSISSIVFAQSEGYIQINSNDIIHYIVTDPYGNRTGRDPRNTENPQYGRKIDEISNAGYAFMSVGDIPEAGEEPHEDISHEFIYTPVSPDNNGEHKIDVIGIRDGTYEIYISIDAPNHNGVNYKYKGPITKNMIQNFEFYYSDVQSDDLYCKKIVVDSTLIIDIELCYQFDHIKDKGIYNSLKKKGENAIKQHEKGKNNAAVNILNAFINEVNAQKGKKIDEWEAENVLIYDAQELIDKWKE